MTLSPPQVVGLVAAWFATIALASGLQYSRLARCRRWIADGFRREQARIDAEAARAARMAEIPTVPLEDFDPVFRPGEFGPTVDAEVSFISRGNIEVLGGTSDLEAWILAVLAKSARSMFEFGTCTGKTTYLWARNSPPDASIVTLTLAPEQVARYQRDEADLDASTRRALNESAFERFLYTGTDVEHKVEQRFGDSKEFDESAHLGRYDLIFVDGSHAYSYVVSDSEKALRMVRPGGVVLWHDYRATDEVDGVLRCLGKLRGRLPLVHLQGTSLVAYRVPEDSSFPFEPPR